MGPTGQRPGFTAGPLREGVAAYQLVGGVTAHQGFDG